MNPGRACILAALAGLGAGPAAGSEEFFDRLGDQLTFGGARGTWVAQVGGVLDVEAYALPRPAPGLIYTPDRTLLNPRLIVFLDAEFGERWYLFAQARVDRGFDPADGSLRLRLDEYALRFTPRGDRGPSLQVGQFAAVIGSWIPRHGSWENPFVTAPLVYENVTGIWDSAPARTAGILLAWAHVTPLPPGADEYADKHLRQPVIWGPSYATGVAVFGDLGPLHYAVELKNAAPSSRPEAWRLEQDSWRHPTGNARVAYRPSPRWQFGLSASRGPYLRPSAAAFLAAGQGLGDHRQTLLGQDVSFAWHHWQVWAEAYQARFAVPRVGEAKVDSHYVEVRYKLGPALSLAARWNEQHFGDITRSTGQRVPWGRDIRRLDLAPAIRFGAHQQLKLQYSLLREAGATQDPAHLWAAQFTVRF